MTEHSAASDSISNADQTRWFAEEVHPHDSSLRSYLTGSFPNVRDVEDVVQESYLRVWKARAARPIQSARAFLFTVARHVAIDVARHNRASPIDTVEDLSELSVIEDRRNAFDFAETQERIRLLGEALAVLPDRCREIVVLRKLKGLSQKEVAVQLGLSEEAVEHHVSRGLKRCEAHLCKFGSGIYTMKSESESRRASGHAPERPPGESDHTTLDWPRHAGAVDAVLREMDVRVNRRRRLRRRSWRFAGAVAALLAIGFSWEAYRVSPTAVPPAARQVLPDGSVVEMKTGAEIAIEFSSAFRRVTLKQGEAYFQVAKNPLRPFVVQAGGAEVRAVGTAFAVDYGRTAVEIIVTEGRVSVARPPAAAMAGSGATISPKPSAFVSAGQHLVLDIGGQPGRPAREVQAVSEAEISRRLAWCIPKLELSGMSLAEAIPLFNQHSRVRLVLDDPALEKVRLSGVVRADNIDALLLLLESDYGIKADYRSETEIILHKSP